MHLNAKLLGSVVVTTLLAACSTTAVHKEYADYVNPFIGTGGHGHTFPGAIVPTE